MVSFCFLFYKIFVKKQWGVKYVILVEDSDTGGGVQLPMKHLFGFGGAGQKVSFVFLFLMILKKMRMRG